MWLVDGWDVHVGSIVQAIVHFSEGSSSVRKKKDS